MTWLEAVARQLGVPVRANRKARRAHSPQLGLTRLEDRTVPTSVTWDGGDADDSLWSSPDNWVGDVAPTAGEDLVFPAGASRLSNVNDFTTGMAFGDIAFGGSGYTISGNSITLGGSVTASYASGGSEFAVDMILTSNPALDVASGGTLDLSGAILFDSAMNGRSVTKGGGGTLRYSGSTANTYNGSTTVTAGTLVLAKTNNVTAANGNVTVGDNTTAATLVLQADNQFWPGSGVTVNEGSTFDVGTHQEFISVLTLQGATTQIDSGGVLKLFSQLLTTAASSSQPSNVQGFGALELVNAGVNFSVDNDPSLLIDLRVSTVIQGSSGSSGFFTSGQGVLALSGSNTFDGDVTVGSGAVQVESAAALGTTAGGTSVASGASVFFDGAGLTVAEDFSIAGVGYTASGALAALSGDATLTGGVLLADDSQVGASVGSTLTLNGVIGETGGGRSLTILQASSGRTVLGGSNTYTGGTVGTGGYIRAASDNAFGDPSTGAQVDVQSGTTLELAGGITLPATKTIAISGLPASNASKVTSVSGDNTIAGDIAITGGNNVAFDVAGGTTLTASGVISGARDFDKNGSGTLVLTGTSTHTGNVNVGDGQLIVNGSLATSNSVFVDGTLGGTGTLPAVTVSSIGRLAPGNSPGLLSTGDLTFSDSGSTYSIELDGATAGTQYDQTAVTGTVTLAGATLSLSLGYAPALGAAYTIINNDLSDAVSGTFNGLAEGATITIGATTLTVSYVGGDGNDVVLTVTDVTYVWDGEGSDRDWTNGVNWVGDVAPTAGANLVFGGSAVTKESLNSFAPGTTFNSITITSSGYDIYGNAIDLTNGITTTYTSGNSALDLGIALLAGKTFDIAGGGTLTYTGNLSGGFGLTKTGVGTLALAGTNTYTGTTLVTGGTLTANSLGNTSGLTLDGGTLSTVSTSMAVGVTLTVGSGGATVNLSNGTITLSGVSGTGGLTVNSLNGGNVLSTGTDNSGTFSGTTTVNNGILEFGHNAAYGTGSIVINGGKVRGQGATPRSIANALSLGGTLTMSGAASLTFTGTVDLLAGTRTINDSITSDLTFSGVISNGNLTVNSQGSGTVVLSGTNTYSATTVTSGTLSVTGDSNLGSGAVTLNGGTLVVTAAATIDNTFSIGGNATVGNANALTLSGALSGGGFTLTKGGAGTLTLTNTANESGFSGGMTATAGAIAAADDDALPAGTLTLQGGGLSITGTTAIDNTIVLAAGTSVFDVSSGETVTANGVISETGGTRDLDKGGGGTLLLAGTASYTGNTVINGGTLRVGSDAAVGSGQIILNNGLPTLEVIGSLGRDIDVNNTGTISTVGSATLSGIVSGTGALTKAGAGVLTLSGTATHSGAVTVSAGTLIVNGSLATSNGVVVSGTLGGSGAVADVTVSPTGTLAPGNSPGVLSTGDLTFAGGSTYDIELHGTTLGTQYDQTDVTGVVTLGDATLALTLGFSPAAGDTFTIVSNDGSDAVSGTFAGLVEGSLITSGATTFRISYVGGTGNDVVLTVVESPTVAGTASANPSTFGQAVTFSVTVTGTVTPTGNVTLRIGGAAVQTVALSSGSATFAPVSNLAVGGHTVSFEYAGDSTHLPASGDLVGGQVVNKAATTVVIGSSNNPSVAGQGVTFTATVGSTGETPTGTVSFRNVTTGETLATVTLDASGAANWTTSELAVGTNWIDVEYTGDGNFTGSLAGVNQEVIPAPVAPPSPPVAPPSPPVAPPSPPVAPPSPPVVSAPPLLTSIGSQVQVVDPGTGQVVSTFTAFPGFGGEVVSATADLNGDDVSDLAIGAGAGGGPHVRVFDGATGAELQSFFAFHQGFTGGVNLATGDVNGDGVADLIVAAGPGGGPHVKVFDGRTFEVLNQFFAYDVGFAGGVSVAAGDLDGDGRAEIVTAAGPGGGPHVKVFDGRTLAVVSQFFAYDVGFAGGVDVAVRDLNRDGLNDIVTAALGVRGTQLKAFDGRTLALVNQFLATDATFEDGLSVG